MNYYKSQKRFASMVLGVAVVAIVIIGGYFLIPKNSTPTTPSQAAVIEIRTGTSFGECVGYCKVELAINSKKIIYTKNGVGTSYPEVRKERPISVDKWSDLIGILDAKEFILLPEIIGCPDCADGGAEWIEIFDGKTVKKVTFEYGASIPGIDPLVKKLREIRDSIPESNASGLEFFAGGSIFGSSFEVTISGSNVTYREATQGGAKEANKINRSLLPAELDDIRKTISSADLINLQSQDFTKEPLAPDQAAYRITVSLDGKENKISCGIPPPGTEPTTNCQKQIDKLRLKLNSILGVSIY